MLNTDPLESQNEMMRWMIYYMVSKLADGLYAIDYSEMRNFFLEEKPQCMVTDIENGIAFKVIVSDEFEVEDTEDDFEVVDTEDEWESVDISKADK